MTASGFRSRAREAGLGLKGMRERLANLSSHLDVGARPGGGVRLAATIRPDARPRRFPQGTGMKVLIIDDHAMIRSGIKQLHQARDGVSGCRNRRGGAAPAKVRTSADDRAGS